MMGFISQPDEEAGGDLFRDDSSAEEDMPAQPQVETRPQVETQPQVETLPEADPRKPRKEMTRAERMLLVEPDQLEESARMDLLEDHLLLKRRKIGSLPRGFAAELLARAPSRLETCRSLQLFCEKQLPALQAAPPSASGGSPRAAAYADAAGRLEGLEAKVDPRVRRVLDVPAMADRSSGKVDALRHWVEAQRMELSRSVANLEEVTQPRRAWAAQQVKRQLLMWCQRLLQAREANLAGTQCWSEQVTEDDILDSLLCG
ncbi:unnamed protein product [Effrenium voratum]|nr:unnamed protein product [Effrenium voratum]CAJ1332107.1 unnamed protein product [Effrenium voratum]